MMRVFFHQKTVSDFYWSTFRFGGRAVDQVVMSNLKLQFALCLFCCVLIFFEHWNLIEIFFRNTSFSIGIFTTIISFLKGFIKVRQNWMELLNKDLPILNFNESQFSRL